MQLDRRRLRAVADHGDHQAIIALLTFGNEPIDERAADAAALRVRRDVDRILHGVAIGRPRAVRARIRIAHDGAADLRHEIRIAGVDERALTPRHLGFVRRLVLERCGAVAHRVRIDAGDGGDVGRRCGADVRRAHSDSRASSYPKTGFSLFGMMLPKTKAPRRSPGRFANSALQCLAPVAEQAQQHQEQVDEVEVERQRAHDSLAPRDRAVIVGAVHLLDLLRVVGGEAREHDHADHRDDPVEPARAAGKC